MLIRLWSLIFTAGLTGLLTLAASAAASSQSSYQEPPENLTRLIDAQLTPWVFPTPKLDALLIIERPSLPTIAELSEPELRLAGMRLNPRLDSRSRERYGRGISLVTLNDNASHSFSGLPEQPKIAGFEFSPDGAKMAFTHITAEHIELWIADLATRNARRLSERPLHTAAGVTPVWLDNESLVATFVPVDRGPVPEAPRVPAGPVVRENLGIKAQARTYQDLLNNAHDEALFTHHLTAQLALVSLDGEITTFGTPALWWDFQTSPDGRFILVETLQEPFSYLVPASRFPRRIEILDRQGATVSKLADLPLFEAVPIAYGSVTTGMRNPSWRDDAAATLVWAEAQDGGDASQEAEIRDRLFVLEAPFQAKPTPWTKLSLRFSSIQWSDADLALVTSRWWQDRTVRTEWIQPGSLNAEPRLVFDRSSEDRYSHPGVPLTKFGPFGRPVLMHPEDRPATLYFAGEGASPEGNRPFVDLRDLNSSKVTRLFHSEAPYYERPVTMLPDGSKLLTRRESADEPPNYRLRDLGTNTSQALTHFPHPAEQLAGITKELITYQRNDGVQLSATLYLPTGYKADRDGPLPTLMWAYPQEFKSAAAAAQVTDSPYRFHRLNWSSPILWVSQGYAVLDDPKMPIIGEGEVEPNDSFRTQLVASAQAAVDEVVRRGVSDRHRIAIGGHSYGAFMTANLLAHSDLFAAGVARSGAYNRTLTPFGFQAEQRTFWQAPDVYFTMSPFMHAEKVDEPILLIHGAADNNSGTFPMQSERFYHALKGHGATARLVMLEHESHGYRARESILHMMWETNTWLDRYVRNANPPQTASASANNGSGGSNSVDATSNSNLQETKATSTPADPEP